MFFSRSETKCEVFRVVNHSSVYSTTTSSIPWSVVDGFGLGRKVQACRGEGTGPSHFAWLGSGEIPEIDHQSLTHACKHEIENCLSRPSAECYDRRVFAGNELRQIQGNRFASWCQNLMGRPPNYYNQRSCPVRREEFAPYLLPWIWCMSHFMSSQKLCFFTLTGRPSPPMQRQDRFGGRKGW